MSHQTGIGASAELKDYFATSKDGNVRLMKIAIRNEELVLEGSYPPSGTWEDDWDRLILSSLVDAQPCYLLYRLDQHSDMGFQWIYLIFSPDNSPVREKMLYAATRATLKMEFGGGQIKDEVYGNIPEDIKLTGFKRHIVAQNASPPRTFAEQELEEIKKTEVHADISVDSKLQTISGVSFPVSRDAMNKLLELKSGSINYVQLSLDLEKEVINLESFEDTDANTLRHRIPTDHARYHVFNYHHSHEGDYLRSIVFIYSMPGYKCSIKERMLYSSCKAPLLDVLEQQVGLEVVKKIEVDDPSDVTEQFVYEEVHPNVTIVRPQFARPKGPGGRGPKRLTKASGDQ